MVGIVEEGGDLMRTGCHEGSVVADVHEGRVVDCHGGDVDVHEGRWSVSGRDVMGVHVGLAFVRHEGDSIRVFHEGTLMKGRTCDRTCPPGGQQGATTP